MNADRTIAVMAAVSAAAGEDMPVNVRHVCLACASVVGVAGVGLFVVRGDGPAEPVIATDSISEQVMEAQLTLGEGPMLDVLASSGPVLMANLRSAGAGRRWPNFAPVAESLGIAAVFAFPLVLGAISVGVLELYRTEPDDLTPSELTDALLFSDVATLRVLDHLAGLDVDTTLDGFEHRWAAVHQATGVVSAQLDVPLAEALVRLRAHAYLTERRLSEIAHDVLAGDLRLEPRNADENADQPDDQTEE